MIHDGASLFHLLTRIINCYIASSVNLANDLDSKMAVSTVGVSIDKMGIDWMSVRPHAMESQYE